MMVRGFLFTSGLAWLFCLAMFPALGQRPVQTRISFNINYFPAKVEYLLYKPAGTEKQPLLIYLHGSGASGDIGSLREEGIPKLIDTGKKLPFIVASPSLPLSLKYQWKPTIVDEVVKHVMKTANVDASRIYVTGYGIGANAAWEYAAAFPKKVAAVVAISGATSAWYLCNMKDVPAWLFVGLKDKATALTASRNTVNALKKCGGIVQTNELANVGHNAWKEAYNHPGVFEWMLSKNKRDTLNRKKETPVVKKDPPKKDSVKTTTPLAAAKKILTYDLPKSLNDITGVTYRSDGQFYGITNRSGLPVILTFDTAARVDKVIRLQNAANLSWQDITRAKGNVYVADVGNENLKRKFFQVYKASEADMLQKESVPSSSIEFTLNGIEPLDFKSLFVYKDSLYLFGESASRVVHLVRVADKPGSNDAELVGKYPNLKMASITSAAYDADRDKLLLLSEDGIGVAKSINSLGKTPLQNIPVSTKTRKHGVTLLPNGSAIVVDQVMQGTTSGSIYLVQVN